MKKTVGLICAAFGVLTLLPLLAVTFATRSGMMLTILLFFAVNPVFFVWLGVRSGSCIKKRWFLPALSAVIYVVSSWLIFDAYEPVFLIYAGVYLAIGTVAMLIRWLFAKTVR